MQFAFSEEQLQFRDIVKRFAMERSPSTEVRRLMETEAGFDPAVWQQLSGELGLTALEIPEEYGGSGFGPVELGIVMEELGRALVCVPFFSSAVLATRLTLEGGSEENRAALLPELAAGTVRGSFALVEGSGSWELDDVSTRAEPVGDQWRIHGSKRFVIDGHTADFILVAAQTGKDLGLFIVRAESAGLKRKPAATMDATRKLADIELDGAAATLLGPLAGARAAIERTLDRGAVALAHEMVGGAQALLDSAVAYAGMRVQFGRTIGSFQAIKHKCADMLLDVELARSAAYAAAEAAADEDPQAPALACLAKAATSDAYLKTAAQTIQIHGGIGFTWENDTHLWFKRAKSSELMLGDPTLHRERLMQRWGH
jgi:alkylation response protein AidB-like acyl-CoA dehydrogenase